MTTTRHLIAQRLNKAELDGKSEVAAALRELGEAVEYEERKGEREPDFYWTRPPQRGTWEDVIYARLRAIASAESP